MRDLILIAIGAFIGGWVSAAMSRRRHDRAMEAERARLRSLLLAEYAYWRDPREGEPVDDIIEARIGAMAACANVLAATTGHLAPWHNAEPKGVVPCPTSPK